MSARNPNVTPRIHPMFQSIIDVIKPEDASAKRVGGAEAAPQKRKWIESPDAGTPNYEERD